MRTGAFSYVLIGALAIALLGIIALAFTSKQISDRESEVAKLQVQAQQAEAKAQSLQAFANFRAVQDQRSPTITSLAQRRFDWQRVLNELSRVVPSNIWLVQLQGTANPQVSVPDGPEITIRDDVTGPALSWLLRAQPGRGGRTRLRPGGDRRRHARRPPAVGEVEDSGSVSGASVSSASGEDTTTECRTNNFLAKFEIVVAFDSVPVPAGATTTPSVPSSLATTASSQVASQSSATPPTGG
jgi:hypothetical protein